MLFPKSCINVFCSLVIGIIEPELRWTTLHPEHWTTNEVRSWLDYVAERHNIISQEKSSLLEEFCDINGPQLLRMSVDDFQFLSPQCGKLLFDVFSNMCKNAPGVQCPHSEGAFPLPPISEDNGGRQSLLPKKSNAMTSDEANRNAEKIDKKETT